MNNKLTFKKTAAILLALGLTVGATGCEFIIADSVKDLNQVVATVDISEQLASDEEFKSYADDIDALIAGGALSTNIPKRDLVAYFLNVGYTYVQSYGYTYKDTFNMLMDGLTDRKILTQYAVAYYIKKAAENPDQVKISYDEFVTKELAAVSEKEKALLESHPEVLTMKYYLTDFGNTDDKASMKTYLEAEYGLKKSLNDSLDSAEKNYIKADDDVHTHEETRTMPTNVNTEKEEYLPLSEDGKSLNYDIYTGRNEVGTCGVYEAANGSTKTTRKKAYNTFLSNLQGYGLISKEEDTQYITQLDYYYMELSSTLGQALISKYYEELEDAVIAHLTDNNYQQVIAKYNDIYNGQRLTYTEDYTAFDTALDSVSDSSFLLYGMQDFGFVYNILIPFSDAQNQDYSAAQKKYTQDELFAYRRTLLEGVKAKDLRGSWLCKEDENAYKVTDEVYFVNSYLSENADADKYLFFENNVKNTDKYQELTLYKGAYPYNGKVELVDDDYKATPAELSIDGFMTEMNKYINKLVGADIASGDKLDKYSNDAEYPFTVTVDGEDVVDYSKFMYYEGSVNFTDGKGAANHFDKTAQAYNALAAVNELMFAYSTDTGCLNSYLGYAVSPYGTDFVPEFEYAAQYVVRKGVGSYVVAPSQYGWHIIYCSFKFDQGDVYGGFNAADVETEGTFSYMFYESLKSTTATNHANAAQSAVLEKYETAATRHVETYQDLLDLD